MTKIGPDQVVFRLDALLDQEKAAILAGELEKLGEIAAEKLDLIENSTVMLSDSPGLAGLRRKAARNDVLLQHVAEGIRDVARRMGAMADVRSGLKTYDHTGKEMQNILATARSVEKRS